MIYVALVDDDARHLAQMHAYLGQYGKILNFRSASFKTG